MKTIQEVVEMCQELDWQRSLETYYENPEELLFFHLANNEQDLESYPSMKYFQAVIDDLFNGHLTTEEHGTMTTEQVFRQIVDFSISEKSNYDPSTGKTDAKELWADLYSAMRKVYPDYQHEDMMTEEEREAYYAQFNSK